MARRPATGWPDVPSIGHRRRFARSNARVGGTLGAFMSHTMYCREQGRFVAGIQNHHEAVEYRERRAYCSLIRRPEFGRSRWSFSVRWTSYGAMIERQPTTSRKMRV